MIDNEELNFGGWSEALGMSDFVCRREERQGSGCTEKDNGMLDVMVMNFGINRNAPRVVDLTGILQSSPGGSLSTSYSRA
jgi:hypothetical protein